MFLLNILKDLINLCYKKRCKTELGKFLVSEFPMAICQFW